MQGNIPSVLKTSALQVSERLLEHCARLTSNSPVLLPFTNFYPPYHEGQFHLNTVHTMSVRGGQIMPGWVMEEDENQVYATPYSVWCSLKGELVNVTPFDLRTEAVVFLPDPYRILTQDPNNSVGFIGFSPRSSRRAEVTGTRSILITGRWTDQALAIACKLNIGNTPIEINQAVMRAYLSSATIQLVKDLYAAWTPSEGDLQVILEKMIQNPELLIDMQRLTIEKVKNLCVKDQAMYDWGR